jgi:hypothetical protein
MQKLTSKDWVRMLIAFLLGVAVTLLVIQLTGGQLFQGALTGSLDVAPTTTERTLDATETSLETSLERLSTGLRIDKPTDDASGMAIDEPERAEAPGDLNADIDPDGQVDFTDLAELESAWLKDPDPSVGEIDDTVYVIRDDN